MSIYLVLSEKNSIFAKSKGIFTMTDFSMFDSLYSVWRYNTRGMRGGGQFEIMFKASEGVVDYMAVRDVA